MVNEEDPSSAPLPDTDASSGLTALRALGSALFDRASLARRAGLTFGGKRDLFLSLGYPDSLRPIDYRARYSRGDIAQRIVSAKPFATWRGGAELIEDENPETVTTFEQAWIDLEARLGMWSLFSRADVLAGLGRFSVLFLGAPGKWEEELPSSSSASQTSLIYISPYGEQDITFSDADLDLNPESPRFGLPNFYTLTRPTGSSPRTTLQRRIHHSRILHIADGLLDDPLYGEPRLQCVWNRLEDLDKVVGGGSEAFWLRVHQGMFLNLEKDVSLSPDEQTKLKEAVDDYVHNLRRVIPTRGAEIQMLGSDVAPFDRQVDGLITLIAGTTGIPKRILVGSERGELSSAQDREAWDTLIADRRKDFAEKQVVRPLIARLQEKGYLPPAKEYQVRWPEIGQLSPKDRASVADTLSGLNKKVGGVVITPEEIRDTVLGLGPLDESEVDELQQTTQQKEQQEQQGPGQGSPNPNDGEEGEEQQTTSSSRRASLRAAKLALGKARPPSWGIWFARQRMLSHQG